MRKNTKIILATLIFFGVSITTALILYARSSPGFTNEPVNRLEVRHAYLVKPVSINNARWQMSLIVANRGDQDIVVDEIYVNGLMVKEMGLIHGELLSTDYGIGTSVPKIGLLYPPGNSETIYIWIGSDLFEKGNILTVEIKSRGVTYLNRTITLD